ncbi:MAG TPA: hypothetical protein VGR35_10425 [Tepidisphaeraceae bacterium]|nr:hypothetical protein [Tepidisphaeraceae bacterium]
MARVYLETSFISACVSTRTDVSSLYRKQESLSWWADRSREHALFISSEVARELSHPAYPRREQAMKMIEEVPVLELTPAAMEFARVLVIEKVMPAPELGDAAHVAIATLAGIEYMVSWNVRHLANIKKVAHLNRVCAAHGHTPPRIVTPEMM